MNGYEEFTDIFKGRDGDVDVDIVEGVMDRNQRYDRRAKGRQNRSKTNLLSGNEKSESIDERKMNKRKRDHEWTAKGRSGNWRGRRRREKRERKEIVGSVTRWRRKRRIWE